MKKIATLILIYVLMSLESHAASLIEEWIEPAVDIEFVDGTWQIFFAQDLPKPPITISKIEGTKLLVNLRRIGLVWVGRSSVRLNEETLLLDCQENDSPKAPDYKNFGMRKESDNTAASVKLTCINNTDQ